MTDKRLQVGDLRLHVRDEGDGEPVVMLHGFPDSSKLWRHQIPVLLEAGFRVIAPDLRGLGESDRPEGPDAYRFEILVADMLGIMDALSISKAHFVGHDFGAAVGWLLAGIEPTRVASLSALSVGHPNCFLTAGLDQREKSWYVLLFQFRDVAEKLLMKDDWRLLRELFRHHPEIENWIAGFERPGALTSALNLYRANMHPAQWFSGRSLPNVAARTLGIWSSNDHYLTEAQMLGSAQYVDGPWRYMRLEGPSHWLQLDRPDAINHVLLNFLQA